jgi:putative membrane protein insertion efficiency factor
MIRKIALWFLKLYQRFFTLLGYGSCRYYPTCSEYAKWQFLHNNIIFALYHSIVRILRCNQLFEGGIDYPIVNNIKKPLIIKRLSFDFRSIRFYFVPKKDGGFFVVKSF